MAAIPYPSPQGTQAAIAAMMRALTEAGRDARLLTYAGGDASLARAASTPGLRHTRLARSFGDRSLRSGPSLAKIAEDVALARAIAASPRGAVVAHHVEAAAAALLARRRPLVFVAHTALGPELPTYLPRLPRSARALARLSGEALDAALARAAHDTLAISPRLAERLSRASGATVRWLPLPWTIPAPIDPREVAPARAALGLYPRDRVLLYAGNLDRYQGLDALFEGYLAAARARPHDALRLLVATASDPSGVDLPGGTIVVRLDGSEAQRRRLHAAADVVVVPREAEGGLPIKLVDALARGVPVACVPRATAGLALHGCAAIDALPTGLCALLQAPDLAREFVDAGRAFVARELSAARFLEALDASLARASAGATGRRADVGVRRGGEEERSR